MENDKTSKQSQDRELREMEYSPSEDIFSRQDHISLDADGNPVSDESDLEMEMDLDVPGADADDAAESVGSEDEENNYWSLGGENHDDLEQSED